MFVRCEYMDEFKEIQTNVRTGRQSSNFNNLAPLKLKKTNLIPMKKKT